MLLRPPSRKKVVPKLKRYDIEDIREIGAKLSFTFRCFVTDGRRMGEGIESGPKKCIHTLT
jgi:hypothetical protein